MTRAKIPQVIPFAPSPAFLAVHSICLAAERAGWPGPEAFAIAMRLYVEGIRPAQAEQLFADAERRKQ